MELGDLSIDVSSREVTLQGMQLAFTAKEFDLLVFLAATPRRVLAANSCSSRSGDPPVSGRTRQPSPSTSGESGRKIEADPDNPKRISTVRGVGYRFEPI